MSPNPDPHPLTNVANALGYLAAKSRLPVSVLCDAKRMMACGFDPERGFYRNLSTQEIGRFQMLLEMARRGEEFTPDQVIEFNALIDRLPRHAGLESLGAFLKGLYLIRGTPADAAYEEARSKMNVDARIVRAEEDRRNDALLEHLREIREMIAHLQRLSAIANAKKRKEERGDT